MKKLLLAFAAILLFSVPAQAFDNYFKAGPYVSAGVGGQYIAETDISKTPYSLTFDVGYGGTVAAGYKWKQGWRVELEGSYFTSDLGRGKEDDKSIDVDGSLDMKSIMGNVLYEFSGTETRLFSYLGAGVGYGWSDSEIKYWSLSADGSTSIPLVQPIVGIGYRLTENISLDLDYKLKVGLKELDYDGVKGDYLSNRVTGGIRFTF
ncbi:outer membrane protein [Maridesulfovibrio ferrireducens]|uniref:outer membrane protein n=1 Tax=Maridesulfovibrio ferrireducens TaxID=246191 RepID=UPI001A2A6DC9|nr:porin family protein [Maridesulfovibrio ferrireducens]MBI9112523.1 porin family protein [Maridesulfovibrio ferrireducens]